MSASLLWPRRDGVPSCLYTLPGRDAAWAGSALARGRTVPHEAVPLPLPSGRRMAPSMADLIYGQLHLIPSSLEFGLLAGVQTREVTLWNATFAPVELLRITGTSPQGTALSGIEAGTLSPTGVAKGLLTILESGPAQQNTTYTFVTDIGEQHMTITASRVLLFPFWPDWSGGIEQDYTFDTVIARSESGSEQRRPLVKRPLRTLRASVWGDGVNGQRLHNLVRQGKDRVFGVPLWQEALEVGDIDATRRVLMVERPFGDCWNLTRLCRLVMLHERRSGLFMSATLSSRNAEAGTLELTVSVPDAFAAGSTRVVPLFTGILTRAEPSSRSAEMETWSLEFRELAGSQPELGALPHAPGGGPWVWTHRADWSDAGSLGGTSALVRTLRTVRGGVMELGSSRAVAPITHRQSYLLRGAELASLLDRVTALRGRWRPVYVRDPRRAFLLTREAFRNESVLYARDNGARNAFAPGQRLWIAPPSGEPFSRALTAVEAGAPGELALRLGSVLDVGVPAASFVGREYLARLDTDNVTIRYHTAGVSRCSLTFCTVPEEEA